MTQLVIYLICVALLVLGSLGFIAALGISGRIRMMLACLAACVPIAAGIWLFQSSGLRSGDFDRLLAAATQDIQQMPQNLKEAQSVRSTLKEMLHSSP